MNCSEAQRHLFAAGDVALDNHQRAALDAHVAHCAACRRIGDDLAAALTTWREDNRLARVPDVEREWHAIRRRMRGAGSGDTSRSRRHVLPWLALPLGAAAAIALTFYVGQPNPSPATKSADTPAKHVARADSVEVPDNASTMVYVDDKSGWLIVWASDANQI